MHQDAPPIVTSKTTEKVFEGLTRGASVITLETFREVIEQRMQIYQCVGLDALRDLADMPLSTTNAMLMQVKLLAARTLAQVNGSGLEETQRPLDNLLKDMSADYHKHAPRIKEVRERIVTYEQGAAAEPRVINGTSQ